MSIQVWFSTNEVADLLGKTPNNFGVFIHQNRKVQEIRHEAIKNQLLVKRNRTFYYHISVVNKLGLITRRAKKEVISTSTDELSLTLLIPVKYEF